MGYNEASPVMRYGQSKFVAKASGHKRPKGILEHIQIIFSHQSKVICGTNSLQEEVKELLEFYRIKYLL